MFAESLASLCASTSTVWGTEGGRLYLKRLLDSPTLTNDLQEALLRLASSAPCSTPLSDLPLDLPLNMVEDWSNVPPTMDVELSIGSAVKVLGDQKEELTPEVWMEALRNLNPLSIARLLSCRFTKGAPQALLSGYPPVDPSLMEQSFNALHCPTAKITVGARALAKHLDRDGTHFFWGRQLHGSEEAKNDQARAVLLKLLSAIVWRNVYMLPHDIVTFEVRVKEGYGARWVYEGDSHVKFRGFLEPHDTEGHNRGWKH